MSAFIDTAVITIQAGSGGSGAVAFHREKFVNAGGPDGGDGGRGGDVFFVADDHLSTLADFRYKRKYTAENGNNGGTNNKTGKSADALIIRIPRGTVIRDRESGRVIADISDDEPVRIARGGRGGWGNARFATPTRQIPNFAKPGQPGQKLEITLELKLLADVGLVGFPNVGKSTLISRVSEAKPKIANYHFTTLSPVLGVVRLDSERSFVMADIPGLIKGASDGAGLGHEFLRHVERCRLIVHVVDVSGIEGRNPAEDFELINRELESFNPELAELPQLVAANKSDIASPEAIEDFRGFIKEKGCPLFEVSAATGTGLQPLLDEISQLLAGLAPIKRYEPEPVHIEALPRNRGGEFSISAEDGVYTVEAPWISQALGFVDLDDYESLQYFQRVLRSSGIIDRLEQMGVREGDTVSILDIEFEYIP
ncbi:MAG: GTPase ObgE [Oscillospiraceae bacterium]|nr:GTPase ObgE [Oscillospiraceae bacterium]